MRGARGSGCSIELCPAERSHKADKTEMLRQLWTMFQDLTGVATDQLAFIRKTQQIAA
jgi:hypothetical protein